MANKESIQRSDILTDRALPFLTFKKEFIEKKDNLSDGKKRHSYL